MHANRDRLYGTPGAEDMEFTLADAYEAQVEPYADEHDRRPRQIEEWTTQHPRSYLVDVETLVDWVAELAADNDTCEGTVDAIEDAGKGEDVRQAFEQALSLWADQVTYRQAESLVRTWAITWDADGNPLADGEPIYGKVSVAGEGRTYTR